MEEIKFRVNGVPRRVIAHPGTSLIKVLRKDLRLTGAKRGCDSGHCGSCTVLVDGGAVLGCKYPVSQGHAINRLNVEGQLEGAIVMGMGYALSEEYTYPHTTSFARFRMPRAKDTPEIEIVLVDSPRRKGPFGACGSGELGLVPTAAAIANAVFNACQARVRHLPLTPARVLDALAARDTILSTQK